MSYNLVRGNFKTVVICLLSFTYCSETLPIHSAQATWLGFSIETRLNVFQALNDQELSYFHNTLLEGCNIVRYDHTTWWLLWLQYFKVSGY